MQLKLLIKMDINEFKQIVANKSVKINWYETFVNGLVANKPVEVTVPNNRTITGVRLGIGRAANKLERNVITVVNPVDGKLYAAWMPE